LPDVFFELVQLVVLFDHFGPLQYAPMPKSRPASGDSALRSIPSVERILSGDRFVSINAEFGRDRVKDALAAHLETLRRERRAFDESAAIDDIRSQLQFATASTL